MLLSHRQPAELKILSLALLTTLCFLLFVRYQPKTPISSHNQLENLTLSVEANPIKATVSEKLWYKLGPNGLNDEIREWTNTCLVQNPTFEVEFLTDISGDVFVVENYAFRPDIIQAFLALKIPIVKADLLRYLILYSQGGIWNDLDVSCEDVPIRDWIPKQYRETANLVVGLEFDMGWGDGITRQFASWTIMSRPKSPHMWMVIEELMEALREKTLEHNVTVADLTFDMIGDVVDFSGPRRLTKGILKSLSGTLGRRVDGGDISVVLEPRMIGDVLVLPGYAFANSSTNNWDGNHGQPSLVRHHFAGSWKNSHGGENLIDKSSL
ncbi:Initiation-specific alpha-1,6-mannosyltransferase [Lachnellula suecica]|uniref:Initiation-specific alpha-1,6-mannosyltransferase n=1 Tax=Lachnellula suecica TaxID=602035 RepID=A0A8T9C6Q6_9HELO|nr:Initiation-specific alpha-1,6-mannosyltransferase [Lachnellula suecica]